jgi:long-chain acyl-CoA synthetase
MIENPQIDTINDLFRRVSAAANPRAVLWQDEFGHWLPISSDQIYHRVRVLAAALLSWGAQKGDRIALISENRWEWAVSEFAILAIGAVNVPIYTTLTGEQVATLMRDSGCKIAIVSTRQLFDRLAAVREQTPLERLIIMDSVEAPEGAVTFGEVVAGADDAVGGDRDAVFDALAQRVEPKDPAMLIYTSGTTGEPKGVVLTHGNVAANQNIAAADFDIGPQDACISFLPLSHVTAHALDYVMYNRGAQIIYCSRFDKMPQAMLEVRPTVFVGVPRVFEKIRQEVERQAGLSLFRARMLKWAIRLGKRHIDTVYDGRTPTSPFWKLANKLIYSKVREAFGGRVRLFVSGGAPLGIETTRWFASVGIALWEGYGLTETAPVIALDTPLQHRIGSVGRVLSNVEARIAEDGELLVRGPSVFHEYWQKPEATAAAFDPDGWFLTGDIGQIDEDGYLFITDRKKELLKTSGGKMIAPQPIENSLMISALVSQAALIGDGHKFLSALLAPNFHALEAWARQQGIEFQSHADLVADGRVQAQYAAVVRTVNQSLARFETIKRFRVVAEEWSTDSGELTPSMKLKRRVINERYAVAIDALYADEADAHGGSER